MSATFSSSDCLQIGSLIAFDYPAANYHGVRLRWDKRQLFITGLRDTITKSLDLETLQIDPLLRRGRLLVTGIDCHKLVERTFYRESMVNLRNVSISEAVRDSAIVSIVQLDPLQIVRRKITAESASSYVRAANRIRSRRESALLVVPEAVAVAIECRVLQQWPQALAS
jgi:hypothetical protein